MMRMTRTFYRHEFDGCVQIPLHQLTGSARGTAETLEGLKSEVGEQIVPGIFAAVPYCVDLIGGPYIESRAEVCKIFRPKSALRVAV